VTASPLLELREVTVRFGGLVAVNALSLEVLQGSISALVGPNGAGKTTAFNAVTGLVATTSGSVLLEGADLAGVLPFRRAQLGLARSFQGIRLFPELSVIDNVRAGLHQKTSAGLLASLARTGAQRREEQQILELAVHTIERVNPELVGRIGELARSLPYGLQRHVEVARALVSSPRLLLLDEPAAGLNTGERAELQELIQRLRADGLTVWLIEHDVDLVGRISDEVVVIDHGEVIARGEPSAAFAEPAVVEAYLGTTESEDELTR